MVGLTTLRDALTFLLLQDKSEVDLLVCPGISMLSSLSFRGSFYLETFLLYSQFNLMLNEVLLL